MMNGIFSTAYAAPTAYYATLFKCDLKWLEIHEHFIKQTIRSRCEIATANGTLMLSIPIHQRKNNMPISMVCISYKESWQRQHLKSLETAYQSSPFFEFYIDELKQAYRVQPEYLLDWNALIHQLIMKWLKINLPLAPTISYHKEVSDGKDFRLNEWPNDIVLPYHQVFESKFGYIKNLSVFDLLFNCGNQSLHYLKG
jgi:hypothetical protein